MTTPNVVQLTRFVDAEDVTRALGCSRSTAYEHLRRAARRQQGERGLLRVPVTVWERYAAERFVPRVQAATAPVRRRGMTASADGAVIPITQPRTKPRVLQSPRVKSDSTDVLR